MTAPFNKLDNIQCINKESNDPPNLIKHLPTSNKKQLSNNSCNKVYNEPAIMKIH